MTYQKDIINRNKNHQSPKNTLGMEGRIPAVPEVYNKNFRILRTVGHHQVKTSTVRYIPARGVCCPQCANTALKLYDHYSSKASFIKDEGAKRTLIIKAKRYK